MDDGYDYDGRAAENSAEAEAEAEAAAEETASKSEDERDAEAEAEADGDERLEALLWLPPFMLPSWPPEGSDSACFFCCC